MERAFHWMLRGEYAEAEKEYQKEAQISPNEMIFYELGLVYSLQGKYQQAEEAFTRAIAISPKNSFFLYELAKIYLLQKKYGEAQQLLRKLVMQMPDNAIFPHQLKNIYAFAGENHKNQFHLSSYGNVDATIADLQERRSLDFTISGSPDPKAPTQDYGSLVDPEFVSDATVLHAMANSDATIVDTTSDVTIADTPLVSRQAGQETTIHDGSTNITMTDPAVGSAEKTEKYKEREGNHSATEEKILLEEAIFDDYLHKERLLGQGGMGEVYLVRHLKWDKLVAIKRCSRTDSQILLDRFKRECVAWLTMEKHPNVVSAVHYTYWENKPSLLIEYIEGRTLREIIRDLNMTSMVERILGKLGTRPPLGQVMSLLTFFGGPQERKDISQAWMTIIKEHSRLSLDEVISFLRQSRVFAEFDIEILKNLWPTLPSIQKLPRMSIPALLDFAIQICWGMAHAHSHELLHRDLKPANIIAEQEANGNGVLKITDFGLVKLKGISEGVTHGEIYHETQSSEDGSSSNALGTPRYMPIEQWESPEQVSEKSDIYSFGMVLYELFSCGRSPFPSHLDKQTKSGYWWMNVTPQNEFYYWSTRHCSLTPFRLKTFCKDIPPDIEQIVMLCLEKDFHKRPASFSWIAGELLKIYRRITKQEFPRQQNIAPEMMAMELNNRAVSLFEMHYPEKGQELLSRAIKTAPNLLEIRLNQALYEFLNRDINIKELVSRVTNNFSAIDKDPQIMEIITSIYLEYGVCYRLVQTNLPTVIEQNPQKIEMKRLQAKCLFLRGAHEEAEQIFQWLCTGEKSRIEDWYHFIASLYHQKKSKEIHGWMERAAPHFKFHPCYKEIKRLLAITSQSEKIPKDNWCQVDIWESSYSQDKKINFIQMTPDDQFLLICFGAERKNIIELYDSRQGKSKNYILPFPNRLEKNQIATLPNHCIAFLSTEGFVQLWNTDSGDTRKLATQLAKSSKAQCLGGSLKAGSRYLIACYWVGPEEKLQSLLAVWDQRDWKMVGQFVLPGCIQFLTINPQENMCWFANKDTLYTWRIGTQLDKKGQKYGYTIQRKENFQEVVEVRGVYALPGNSLLILRQKSQGENHAIEFFFWDLNEKQQHKSHTLENFSLQLCSTTPDHKHIILMGDRGGLEATSLLCIWDISKWEERISAPIPLHTRYQKVEVTLDNAFIFFDKEEKSFLDMDFDQESAPVDEPAGVYELATGKEAEIFEIEGAIRYFATTSDHRYAFVVTENQSIYVWKNFQEQFPLYHKLNYLYTKPTSTFQDIGIQNRIHRLLAESEQALQKRDPQKAMDYLRGIQNFKGYDWKLVIGRVYRIAGHYKWKKIGLRESLKVKTVPWSEANVIISHHGDYLFDNAAQRIWDINGMKESDLGELIQQQSHDNPWLASLDGRFLLVDDGREVAVYDLARKTSIGKFANPGSKFQEALAGASGQVLVLKEEGFGEIQLLDLCSFKLHSNISGNKYHTISDCCTLLDDKILLGNECQGGFTWTLLQPKEDSWQSAEYNVDFATANICKEPAEGGEDSIFVTNRHRGIFRGINFDFVEDVQFKHVEIFHFADNSFTSINDEKFRKTWLGCHAIATTDDGVYTFLGLANGSISVWNTSKQRPMAKWRQVLVLQQHEHAIHSLLVTANAQFLISADVAGCIKVYKIGQLTEDRIWEEGDWEVIDTLKVDHVPYRFCLGLNDRYLFAICQETIHIWEFDWVWDVERYCDTQS